MTPEQARAIAAPDSWPWPMSEEARKWVASAQMQASKPEMPDQQASAGGAGHKFNRAEHERFMRGLG